MAEVSGVKQLAEQLKNLSDSLGVKVNVAVGYTQNYAVYVHENLEAHHEIGQAKFLEQPFRELSPELYKQIADDVRAGMTLEQAMLRAGLRLQRESQKLCPVDTGALKNSAFTRKE